ncbi:MAG: class I SAM-dependent methyltransferase [Phycisphaerae bacterium]|jgi:SAM-dependent methyltransferase|nr:class I SAM-dependent methyltransferase [Phycisphaerae bacterium]
MTNFYDNPRFYDSLFGHETHTTFYRNVCESYKGNVLELACGTGQIIGNMQSLPNALFGTDLSKAMIEEAICNYGSTKRISFSVEDMRQFSHSRTYDVVFIARNSLLHLHSYTDFQETLDCIARCLSSEGVFAFDVFNPALSILARKAEPKLMFKHAEHPSMGTVDVYSMSSYDKEKQIAHSEWWLIDSSDDRTDIGNLDLRCIFPQELPLILKCNGFRICHRYGSLTKDPFNSQSGRQVCICIRG